MRPPLIAISVAACCAQAATANFIGYQVEWQYFANGHVAMNVFAKFTNPGDRVVNVYQTNITNNSEGGFYQSSEDPYWKPGIENYLTSDDSWVSIDTNPNGNGNSWGSMTSGDPNFFNYDDLNESTDFSVIQGIGNGAGWYNSHPELQWGYADGPGTRVLLAHFVAADDEFEIDWVTWDVRLTITLAGQTGSQGGIGMGTQHFSWMIPGPGAIGLLGVAGLFTRRARAL